MAEILVRAQASGNPAASEVGDIIVIRPDGHKWGGQNAFQNISS